MELKAYAFFKGMWREKGIVAWPSHPLLSPSLPVSPPFCLETDFHMVQTNLLFATQQRVTLNSVFLPTPPIAEIIGVHRHSRL